MRLRILLVIGFILLSTRGEAATITVGPSSCTASAVNSAIASATDGDTVELTCTGTVTWSTTVTIPNSKGITLKVRGGTYTPAPGTFPLLVTCASGADPCVKVNTTIGRQVSRVTGFRFTTSFAPRFGVVFVEGQGTGPTGTGTFRIDNNLFDTVQVSDNANLQGTVTIWTVNGASSVLTGLVDHNRFLDSSYTDSYVIQINDQSEFGGRGIPYRGGRAWSNPLGWGTSDFIFIEDNVIEQQGRYARHLIAAIQGAKYVARYNSFVSNVANSGVQAELTEAHGYCFCNSIGHGTRGGEIYGNTYSGSQVGYSVLLRGGTWLVYDNNFLNPPGNGADIFLREYRAGSSAMHNQCDASCPSDPTWFNGATDASHYPMHEQIGYNLAGQVEPSYFWNNIRSGVNRPPVVDSAGVQKLYIQENRDYYSSTSKPSVLSSYRAYSYPHPLARGDTTQPSAPANLRAE